MLGEIGEAARQKIKRHQHVAPVDVQAIAKEFGIAVYQSPDLGGGHLSGKLFRDKKHGGESGWSIVVRAGDSFARRRFTVAHEISHFVLHKDRIRDGVLTDDEFYRSGLSSIEETQANRMAADILMPYALIDDCMTKGIKTLGGIAGKLQVSQAALRIRLGIPVD